MPSAERSVYSVGVRFAGAGIGSIARHAAAGLYRRGLLRRLIVSTYNTTEIPANLITSIPLKAVAARALSGARLPPALAKLIADAVIFDPLAARRIPSCRVFHGWNHMALHGLRHARRRYGAQVIVERASSHPLTSRCVLSREYRKLGLAGPWDGRWAEVMLRRYLRELASADVVTVPSRFAYESCVEHGLKPEQLRLIPFGVDTERITPAADPPSGFRVLFVGRVCVRKGVHHLIGAWRKAGIRDGQLILAGQVEPALRRFLPEWSAVPGVRFVGFLPDPVALYRSAALFAFPSLEEGSALVCYEAMAAGLPLIVTREAGALVQHEADGLIVRACDEDQLAQAIVRMYEQPPLRRQLGRAARAHVEAYTWRRYGDEVADLHEQLAGV